MKPSCFTRKARLDEAHAASRNLNATSFSISIVEGQSEEGFKGLKGKILHFVPVTTSFSARLTYPSVVDQIVGFHVIHIITHTKSIFGKVVYNIDQPLATPNDSIIIDLYLQCISNKAAFLNIP